MHSLHNTPANRSVAQSAFGSQGQSRPSRPKRYTHPVVASQLTGEVDFQALLCARLLNSYMLCLSCPNSCYTDDGTAETENCSLISHTIRKSPTFRWRATSARGPTLPATPVSRTGARTVAPVVQCGQPVAASSSPSRCRILSQCATVERDAPQSERLPTHAPDHSQLLRLSALTTFQPLALLYVPHRPINVITASNSASKSWKLSSFWTLLLAAYYGANAGRT